MPHSGAWRSLVARFNGVEEVVGSNPAAPITDPITGPITGQTPRLMRGVYA